MIDQTRLWSTRPDKLDDSQTLKITHCLQSCNTQLHPVILLDQPRFHHPLLSQLYHSINLNCFKIFVSHTLRYFHFFGDELYPARDRYVKLIYESTIRKKYHYFLHVIDRFFLPLTHNSLFPQMIWIQVHWYFDPSLHNWTALKTPSLEYWMYFSIRAQIRHYFYQTTFYQSILLFPSWFPLLAKSLS